jgi:hypothetical protein
MDNRASAVRGPLQAPCVIEAVRERCDLSLVSGVGRVRRVALLATGYANWDDLLNEDAKEIACALNRPRARPLVSTSEVSPVSR